MKPGGRVGAPAPRTRWLIAGVFAVLLAGLGVGLWGTVIRPPAYELRGQIVARPSPGLILVRHEAVGGLGMSAMDLMAVVGEPALLDAAGVRPGDTVRLAVRPRGDELILLRVTRMP